MDLQISPDSAAFLQSQVAAGQFESEGKALDAAVELLRRQAALREKIQRGLQQLENGQYAVLDDEGMDQFFAELLVMTGEQRTSE
jgi:Arc/MetJ-type ribon-helix-helix transcriptional regulator